MIRINLLPHREQKRQARQRQFVSVAIGLAILGLAVVDCRADGGYDERGGDNAASLSSAIMRFMDDNISSIDGSLLTSPMFPRPHAPCSG